MLLPTRRTSWQYLIDPDEYGDLDKLADVVNAVNKSEVDYVFIGGSLVVGAHFDVIVDFIKSNISAPVVIFPGSPLQVSSGADAILFLSVISGRNPETLIGYHVLAAPQIKASGIEAIPTGYMLIESGSPTTASYMSNTTPIPNDKPEIAACTAMAGEMLGLKLIYMDGGSGAKNAVRERMIAKVKESISLPLIIGGGITNAEQATAAWNAGAGRSGNWQRCGRRPFTNRTNLRCESSGILMEIIVISHPDNHPKEHQLLIELFNAGLTRFHLRKPGWSAGEMINYINSFPFEFRDRIVLHGFPELAELQKLKGYHLSGNTIESSTPVSKSLHTN